MALARTSKKYALEIDVSPEADTDPILFPLHTEQKFKGVVAGDLRETWGRG